jgi:hypothetical protein
LEAECGRFLARARNSARVRQLLRLEFRAMLVLAFGMNKNTLVFFLISVGMLASAQAGNLRFEGCKPEGCKFVCLNSKTELHSLTATPQELLAVPGLEKLSEKELTLSLEKLKTLKSKAKCADEADKDSLTDFQKAAARYNLTKVLCSAALSAEVRAKIC